MLPFVAVGLELIGAELALELQAVVYLLLMFIVCPRAVIYFSAGGASHRL